MPLLDNINCSKVSSELGNARYFFDCKIRIYKIINIFTKTKGKLDRIRSCTSP